MAWTTPLTWVVGQLVTAAQLNVHLRDNLLYLFARSVEPGSVVDFAGAAAPTGWLVCDGAAVSRTTYAALFAVIGTTWGVGDGSTTFNLPDLRGRVTVGVGTGSGLTARALAATGGEEAHALTTAELASHAHTQASHSHVVAIGQNSIFTSGGGTAAYAPSGGSVNISAASQTPIIDPTGSGTAHNTMPPFKALNKIIKT